MKHLIQTLRWGAVLTSATLASAALSGCSSTGSSSAMSGASHSSKPWLRFEPIRTADDLAKLREGDEIAMVCSKCQTVEVTKVMSLDSKGRQPQAVTVAEHQCPGCGAKLEVRPDKQTEMVHVCRRCGDKSAFCCVVKKGAPPTPGMENK